MAAEELTASLRAAAADVLPPLPVVFAYLYGSRTGGRSRPDSDVDVGIALDAGVDDPDRIRELASWGVHAVITNRPSLALQTLGRA